MSLAMHRIKQWSARAAACAAFASLGQAQYSANFEPPTYTLGPLEGQNIWVNWTGNNGAFTQVVNTQNHTPGGSQSIRITLGADTVADFDQLPGGSFDTGQWTVRMYSLVPNGSDGQVFFLMMNQWQVTGGPYEWNVQLGLSAAASKVFLTGPNGIKEAPLVFNAWTEIRCEYDLTNNVVTVYYNNVLLDSYDPRCGVVNGCPSMASGSFIDAVDLYPQPGSNPTPIFFDDLIVEQGLPGGPPGTPFCFGDGSGTACPCGNNGGPGQGCDNSTGQGSPLTGTGSDSVTADDLALMATNAIPGQPGLFFQGINAINGGNGAIFGDGLRCAGGSVIRLGVCVPNAGGCASTDGSCGTLPGGPINIAQKGGVSAGDVRRYQWWYRDPVGGPCGSGFNLSNGYEVSWSN